jgi:hypothetical protein
MRDVGSYADPAMRDEIAATRPLAIRQCSVVQSDRRAGGYRGREIELLLIPLRRDRSTGYAAGCLSTSLSACTTRHTRPRAGWDAIPCGKCTSLRTDRSGRRGHSARF